MISYKEKILKFRKQKKLSQTRFANELEVSRSYIAQIEGGSIQPSNAFIEKMINKFNLNPKFFFTDDNKNVNEDFVEKNVHLIDPINVHLFNDSDLNHQKLSSILYNYENKLNNLYQRLIDIKLMNNKQDNESIENGLDEFIDRFCIIRNKYLNDSSYNSSGLVFYEDIEYVDFKKLTKKEMNEYYIKLNSDLNFFEHVFFEYFRKFYNQYMKDRYSKNKK